MNEQELRNSGSVLEMASTTVRDWMHQTESPAFGEVSRIVALTARADGTIAAIGRIIQSLGEPELHVVVVVPNGGHPVRLDVSGIGVAWVGDVLCVTDGRTLRLIEAGGRQLASLELAERVEVLVTAPDGEAVAVISVPDQPQRYDRARPQDSADPQVFTSAPEAPRRLLIVPVRSDGFGEPRVVAAAGYNVWDVAWNGPSHLIAVASTTAGETGWYRSVLVRIHLDGPVDVIYTPENDAQLACPTADGVRIAVIEGIASDRGLLAGNVIVLEDGLPPRRLNSAGIDVSAVVAAEPTWQIVGIRGLETVLASVDTHFRTVVESWSGNRTIAGRVPTAAVDDLGRVYAMLESYSSYPQLVRITGKLVEPMLNLEHPGAAVLRASAGSLERLQWIAPDGLSIEGLLAQPDTAGPHPLVVAVHGGPVGAWRDTWGAQAGDRYPYVPLLVAHGYAVLLPNPRGSMGRGQDFADRVRGDMCGLDAEDILAGVDHVVQLEVADPDRLGVIGNSYGGTMAAHLIGISDRFRAAVVTSPSVDFVSGHLLSDIPDFDLLFLRSRPEDFGGAHHSRSPISLLDSMRAPVLVTAGLLDHSTPPAQAIELHQGLARRGVETELVLYPDQGHGVAGFPDSVDFLSRMLGWFNQHLAAGT